MKTIEILSRKVSFYSSINAKKSEKITLFNALNDIRKGRFAMRVGRVRNTLYLSKDIKMFKNNKKRLPLISFCGLFFDTHFKFDVNFYTQLLIVDIDKLEEEEIDDVFARLKADLHIVSVWKSVSGMGLKALVVLDYQTPYDAIDSWVVHEYCAFPQVEKYFREVLGIQIDKTGGDITRQCFVSYDPDIHLKEEFQPFPVDINLTSREIAKIRKSYNNRKDIRKGVCSLSRFSNNKEAASLATTNK